MRFLSILAAAAILLAVAEASISFREAVEEGNKHFQAECLKQQALMPELLDAIRAKDLPRARTAYTAARPPYEQIETLANAFPDIDRRIDARPYAYFLGEDDPEWQGFHLLERAIYRDLVFGDDVYMAAINLNNSVNELCQVLKDLPRFNPHVVFAGSKALAFEVPAKKVSSEEETWSDLSMMIFRNNYVGIWSQVRPFFRTGQVSAATKESMKAAYQEVKTVIKAIDPMYAFNTTKGDARPYREVTIPERKRIIDAGYRFALALEVVADEALAGLPVPEEEEELEEAFDGQIPFGKFVEEVRAGLRHFLDQCHTQLDLITPLMRALRKGDLMSAEHAYAAARLPYEQIEVLAPDFSMIDGDLDGRPYVHERGERDDEWRGFHEIERDIYRDGNMEGAVSAINRAKEDVEKLCDLLRRGIEGEGSFSAENSFIGMIALAHEVPSKKISSEEETWSDLSVMIYRENLKGIWSQFAPFKDALPKVVFEEVENAYRDIRNFISFAVDIGNDFETGVKFVKYSDVSLWTRKSISDKFYVLGRGLRKARAALAQA